MLQLVRDLQEQNDDILAKNTALVQRNKDIQELNKAQLLALRMTPSSSDEDGAEGAAEAAAPAAATTPLRRSPRRKKRRSPPSPRVSKKRTPPKKQKRKYRRHIAREASESEASETEDDGAPVVRRLSDSVAKRAAKSEQVRFLRKTLGSVIKLNMDEQILAGFFRQGKRFAKEKFEDHVRPIITSIMQGSEVNTDGLSPHFVFKIAIDIAKKREGYKPRTPTAELKDKNERSVYAAANKARYLKTKAAARKIYQTLQTIDIAKTKVAAATKASAAATEASAAAAAAAADPDADLNVSDVERAFASDSNDDADGVIQQLEKYNMEAQAKRNAAKAALVAKKQVAAELAAKKKAAAAAKEKAAAKAKGKAVTKKKKGEATTVEDTETLLKPGMRIMGLWPQTGEWYNGKVLSIHHTNKSCHIQYDDGDSDDDISWDNVRILDDLEHG